jgi:hypothetical protein
MPQHLDAVSGKIHHQEGGKSVVSAVACCTLLPRVMPGQQQLQQLRHDKAAGKEPVAGRTLVGFSFNSGVGGAELIFYEFAGGWYK